MNSEEVEVWSSWLKRRRNEPFEPCHHLHERLGELKSGGVHDAGGREGSGASLAAELEGHPAPHCVRGSLEAAVVLIARSSIGLAAVDAQRIFCWATNC